jgi:hypothetical protein
MFQPTRCAETTGTLARKQFEILGTAAVGTLKSIATSAVESPS